MPRYYLLLTFLFHAFNLQEIHTYLLTKSFPHGLRCQNRTCHSLEERVGAHSFQSMLWNQIKMNEYRKTC